MMKHKILLLFAVVASVTLTCSSCRNRRSQVQTASNHEEKLAMNTEDLRKEIYTLMFEARGAISWKKDILREMNDLVNDMSEAIRKIDCGEITCLNDKTEDIRGRINTIQNSTENLDLRNGNLVQRIIVIKNFIEKDPQLQKQVLSNALIDEIIGMNREWNTIEDESKRLSIVYGERVKTFQSKTEKLSENNVHSP